MKKILFFTAILMLTSQFSLAEQKPTQYQTINGIAAIVNHDIITQGQVDQNIDIIKKQLTEQKQPMPKDDELHKKILDQLISQKLQIQHAKTKNITVGDTQLDEAINNIAKQNNMPLMQLKQAIEAQGLKYAEYREHIRQELTMHMVQQQALHDKEINVTAKEVNDYLNKHKPDNSPKYHLQGILVSVPNDALPTQIETAKQRCEGIIARLRAGADFAQTAALESDGPEKVDGGDLGWHTLSAADPFFAAQIIAAKPDEIVGPLQIANGFYAIKVLEVHADPLPPKEQLAAQVKAMLYQQKYMKAVEDWSKTLREKAYVKVMA
jgi:peptidyl-prolyl cis-trans isomerase SurA